MRQRTFIGRISIEDGVWSRDDAPAIVHAEIENLLADLRFEMQAWAETELIVQPPSS